MSEHEYELRVTPKDDHDFIAWVWIDGVPVEPRIRATRELAITAAKEYVAWHREHGDAETEVIAL